MKKILSVILMLLVIGSSVSFAQSDKITIVIDGNTINTDVNPVVIDGRTLVPIRVVSENLGAKVEWNAETKEVKLDFTELGASVKMKIDSKEYDVNGEVGTMEVAPKMIDGRTMVPIRFISEELGFLVEWDGNTKTVNISSEYEIPEEVEKAALVLESAISENYSEEAIMIFEEAEEIEGKTYYLFGIYENDSQEAGILSLYYVSENLDEIYEWDSEGETLIEVPLK
ncbi:copper amine oxidase-like protein [Gottschalkia acidurici 9a]|uniref:Copper amine oxidase-like protein n=1 Tax=Gottschalkia acidurici (strain ATCC 7906 / DSM 604 / BCRC 14475 / CIP 104303 / KCTC 5404 / NCIMB 10678 / 9a) TaxID=1128398 RepID=K0AVU4_GOTA9|nr:copper amine oxidase N-terminal domain-containing protein [Gottschalkia acidurici]AFS77983.1 copper amine oxidase-like protein [Gottschalkia acidurici 9a]